VFILKLLPTDAFSLRHEQLWEQGLSPFVHFLNFNKEILFKKAEKQSIFQFYIINF